MTRTDWTILLAGGGSGGHLFPALAIAERIAGLPGAPACRFCVSNRPLDAAIMNQAGAAFTALGVRPIPSRPWRIPAFIAAYAKSKRTSRDLIRRLNVKVVVSTGGFVSGPVVAAAHRLGVPALLVNLDAVPGKANRLMARRCAKIFSVYSTSKFPSAQLIGLPLRSGVLSPGDAAHCRRQLGLDPDRPVLLITGASQGAESFNTLMFELFKRDSFKSLFTTGVGWQILHLSGTGRDQSVREGYESLKIPAIVLPFSHQMGLVWGASDLAISRAGAGSVAEIAANGVPAVFLPYPHHKDQHQKLNAQPLIDAGAALLFEDRIDAAANADQLAEPLIQLMIDPARRSAMRDRLKRLGGPDGASVVAQAAIGWIQSVSL